jgi:diguanylate cyclase (GGDEF)-like protein
MPSGRESRSWQAGWAATVLTGIVALVAMLVGLLVDHRVAIWNASWTAAALSAFGGMLLARASSPASARRRWTWWAAAAGAWVLGQIAWDVYAASTSGIPASPNLADAGWWSFALLVIAGLLGPIGRSAAERAVALVEALPIIGAAMALSYALLWPDASHSTLGWLGQVSALTYPGVYVAAAVLTLQAMLGGSLRRAQGLGLRLVLVGMAVQALAFILWAERLLDQSYVPGHTEIDPMWVLSLLAIAAGGVVCGRRPEQAAVEPQLDEPGVRGGLLPALTFVALIGGLVHAQLGHRLPMAARLTLTVGLIISGAMLYARSLLLERRLRGLLEDERTARALVADREADLRRLNERLVEDSRQDPLTGLWNRRALAEDLAQLEAPRRRGELPYAIALLDVDRFKAYNDRLGHLAGDEALRAISGALRGMLRAGDAAYRYGGEELLLVLRGANRVEAGAVAERVRAAVAATALPHPDGVGGIVTVSIGVATGDGSVADLLADADAALYEAKRAGRDRVAVSQGGAGGRQRVRLRPGSVEDPRLGALRSVLAVARTAASGGAVAEVLGGIGEIVRSELGYQVVAMNVREGDELRVATVVGDERARTALEGTSNALSLWEQLLAPRHRRGGASWLPAGTPVDPALNFWQAPPSASLAPDAWHPEDMLLLPMRGHAGELLGVISVDEPRAGRRPDDDEIATLMSVAELAAALLERGLAERAPGAAFGVGAGELHLRAVLLLAETLDLRDAGTAEHSRTVGAMARDTARALGLPEEDVRLVHAAGVVHDVGKLAVPDAILHKPGRLTDAEWDEIRRHPDIGARILEHAGLARIAAWVGAHHERVDGQGYPKRLTGDEIPIEARILAVADAYEAMIAERPYRPALEPERARDELERCAGTQFDGRVVAAFLGTRAGPSAARATSRAAAA